ncbi:nose resistant to fluoxetine protein 6-like isoform X2 [Dermacentor variabilis]|uniref:nose resistant to fluoxetine protein 6-like isoform X2 n=1 Tax=Dermacentor variabilis TaxID=34621 RepID=UPI003F5C0A5B
MFSAKSVHSSSAASLFVLAILLCAWATTPCLVGAEASASSSGTGRSEASYVLMLKEWIANAMDRAPPTLMRKLLKADVSTECSLGLLKMMRGVRNLEPWALRLIDASGKYPTGAFQMSRADLGAFDECVETVLINDYGEETARGQYCNLIVYPGNQTDLDDLVSLALQFTHPRLGKFRKGIYEVRVPLLHLGVCTLNNCNEKELQELIGAVLPPSIDVTISNCVTSLPPALTKGQIAILSFLGSLVLLLLVGTLLDIRSPAGQDMKRKNQNFFLSVVTSFSVASNTKLMLHVAKDKGSEAYRLRFLHGIRFLSIVWVVAGHSYGATSHVWSSMANLVKYADEWQNILAAAGFISVDSFLFLSGFLLATVVCKQKRTGIVIFLFAVIRRLIRTMVPVFFLLMCLYLLPLITSGPNAKAYFESVHEDFRNQWLFLLLQVQNYRFEMNADTRMFPHLWYLCVDFQFFIVSLPILLLLKNRPRIAVSIFALLSLIGCSIATWQVAGNDMTPFIVVVTESLSTLLRTAYRYYYHPFYHAVCYFSGCITFFLVAWFRERKIPKVFQIAAWLLAVASGLTCIFLKAAWYPTNDPTTEFGKLFMAFFDRILWSIFLIWITLACATGRGGFLCTFLSWSAFTPLSRLAFGVYIVHFPFAQLTMHISRERLHYSHFFIVSFYFSVLVWSFLLSYIMFIFCEAPTGRLDKLIFDARLATKEKAVKDEFLNANGAEVKMSQLVLKLRDSKGEFVQQSSGKEAFSSLNNDEGKLTSSHL